MSRKYHELLMEQLTKPVYEWPGWPTPTDPDLEHRLLTACQFRLGTIARERDALAARVAAMEEALFPFSDFARMYHMANDAFCIHEDQTLAERCAGVATKKLTVGHLRAAAAALAPASVEAKAFTPGGLSRGPTLKTRPAPVEVVEARAQDDTTNP